MASMKTICTITPKAGVSRRRQRRAEAKAAREARKKQMKALQNDEGHAANDDHQ